VVISKDKKALAIYPHLIRSVYNFANLSMLNLTAVPCS